MKSLICTGGIALAFAVAFVTGAEAQGKKMSYEQAFAKCKQEMGGGGMANDQGGNTAGRYAAAGGCMNKYGFRLKKKAKI
jgi:hypothetical protein